MHLPRYGTFPAFMSLSWGRWYTSCPVPGMQFLVFACFCHPKGLGKSIPQAEFQPKETADVAVFEEKLWASALYGRGAKTLGTHKIGPAVEGRIS